MSAELAIVIVGMNTRDWLRDCLQSLRAHDDVALEIVVVDNGAVVGSGTHDDLLAGCAAYRELADSQSVSAGEP